MNDRPSRPPFDERYAEPGWAFGAEPNDFLREMAPRIPRGRVLCLAEGQGRNAVHLASLGHDVTAMDLSAVGIEGARRLAAERGVTIHAEVADLADYAVAPGAWQGIVSIFVHVPAELRARVHRAVVAGLAPGGLFVLEAYTPRQLTHDSGGPSDAARLMTLSDLRRELEGLEFEHALETERELSEGKWHRGPAAVVQIAARQPAKR
ncbi:MAG TPA: class I SAM-dependent methyltransferase [Candidatus Acidoferrales bacterium]|nr:class I SAM-dependent methyltransferase [Candidatus Acidoferrales bacterium]